MKRRTLIVIAALIPLVLFAIAVMSLEEPEYRVLKTTDDFELREYQPFLVAETVVNGRFDQVGDRAFRILVDYIQGGNQGGRNLPMTAPVNQQPKIADLSVLDAPGNTSYQAAERDSDAWLFQFVMPKEYSLPMLPQPIDERVTLRQMPARLIAARRYSGGWGESKYRANEQALLDALQRERLITVGTPIFARYNAPFVPGFMRRNEILVEVQRP
ncbi:MAG: heme-binding protein [Thiohalocapsa sp. PB-PSB1]|nr:MAG: heme-binding protein [Thiohalocapsa sp. PB-PSB1]